MKSNEVTLKVQRTDSSEGALPQTVTLTIDLSKFGECGPQSPNKIIQTKPSQLGRLGIVNVKFTGGASLLVKGTRYEFCVYSDTGVDAHYLKSIDFIFEPPEVLGDQDLQTEAMTVTIRNKYSYGVVGTVLKIPESDPGVTVTLWGYGTNDYTVPFGEQTITRPATGNVVYTINVDMPPGKYRVKADTASQSTQLDFDIPVPIPAGGTAETIGGWCVKGAVGEPLCTSTDRWGTKEDCGEVNEGKECIEVYGLLAPLPLGEGGALTTEIETGGGPKGLTDYLKIIFRLMIGIIGILSVLMIVISGIQYMTEETPFGKSEGKKHLTGAIVGLLLALAAVVILQTIDPTIIGLKLTLPQATLEADVPQTAINDKFCTKTFSGGLDPGTDWPTIAKDEAVLPANVSVSSSTGNIDCKKVGDQGCTSIRGLNPSYLNTIRTKCPDCELVVTGATECWLHGGKTHDTLHGPNKPTIDLRFGAKLDAYIKSGTKKRSTYTKDGVSFLKESDHWHLEP